MHTDTNSAHLQKVAYIIGVSLIIGLAILGVNINQSRQSDTITVTGSVKKAVAADLGIWRATLLLNSGVYDAKDQLEVLAQQSQKVKAYAVSVGFTSENINVAPPQTTITFEQLPNYQQSQKPIGYTLRQTITITSNDVPKIAELALAQSILIGRGLTFESASVEYHYSKLAELRPELFAAATKDAKTRAEAIAVGTGNHIGPLRSARTGVIQVLAPHSNDISDYGTYDLSTQQKEVSAVVTASFELKN